MISYHIVCEENDAHLFLNNLHIGICVGKDSRLDPVPAVTLWPLLSSRHDSCTLLFSRLNVREYFVSLSLGDQWTKRCGFVVWLMWSTSYNPDRIPDVKLTCPIAQVSAFRLRASRNLS